jgi:hypothetical protein
MNSDLMEPSKKFNQMLEKGDYSKKTIEQMWKWYDFLEKKGVASF